MQHRDWQKERQLFAHLPACSVFSLRKYIYKGYVYIYIYPTKAAHFSRPSQSLFFTLRAVTWNIKIPYISPQPEGKFNLLYCRNRRSREINRNNLCVCVCVYIYGKIVIRYYRNICQIYFDGHETLIRSACWTFTLISGDNNHSDAR
jgi:hypothetical protein